MSSVKSAVSFVATGVVKRKGNSVKVNLRIKNLFVAVVTGLQRENFINQVVKSGSHPQI